MAESNRGILVFSDNAETRLALLAKARQVEGKQNMPVMVVLIGAQTPENPEQWDADCVYIITEACLAAFNSELYTDALASVIAEVSPQAVLLGTSKRDYELGPRLAERLHTGCVSACVDLEFEPSECAIQATGMIYTGLGIAHYRVKGTPAILLVTSGIPVEKATCRAARVVQLQPKLSAPILQVLQVTSKAGIASQAQEASVVIDVGQGVRERNDLTLIEPLVEALHADVGCTRPVSSERGWFPTWLGLSGRQVTPRLCITLGVSGAIQHMVGIRGSKTIVAVDCNPDSAMLVQADYGVVADLYEFAPVLAEEIKKRGLYVI